jgi:hypothetical protein
MLSEEHVVPGLIASAFDAGDLDGDGQADLVAEDLDRPGLAVLRSQGDRGFVVVGRVDVEDARVVRLADVGGDGLRDLIFASAELDRIGVATGDGRGNFAAPKFYAVGNKPAFVLLGDLNVDGRMDIVTENTGSLDVSVLLGGPRDTFRDEIRSQIGVVLDQPLLADLDGDAALDFVGLGSSGYAMRGKGDGSFSEPVGIVANVPGFVILYGGVGSLTAGRFDGDTLADVVASNSRKTDPTFLTVQHAGACLPH